MGVLAREDVARILDVLYSGADGIILLTNAPAAWRECLHVVCGGGQWLGGPGEAIRLDAATWVLPAERIATVLAGLANDRTKEGRDS